jgi:hypothetical protein
MGLFAIALGLQQQHFDAALLRHHSNLQVSPLLEGGASNSRGWRNSLQPLTPSDDSPFSQDTKAHTVGVPAPPPPCSCKQRCATAPCMAANPASVCWLAAGGQLPVSAVRPRSSALAQESSC